MNSVTTFLGAVARGMTPFYAIFLALSVALLAGVLILMLREILKPKRPKKMNSDILRRLEPAATASGAPFDPFSAEHETDHARDDTFLRKGPV